MIVVKFSGGLGNQMYQYVMYRLLKRAYPTIKVKADISFYNLLCEHNGFEIDKVFKLSEPVDLASKREINSFCPKYIPGRFEALLPLPIKRKIAFNWQYKITKLKSLFQKNKRQAIISGYEINAFNELVFSLNADRYSFYLDGLWQNVNYWGQDYDLIRSFFEFKNAYGEKEQEIADQIKSSNSVSIHVRRGDFVGSTLDICDKEYYTQAIETLLSKTSDVTWFVFSDDIAYAKSLLGDLRNAFFVPGNKINSFYDLMLMSECKHNIISNSTFSFWASILNKNETKVVVAPRYCVINDIGKYKFSLPDSYITIGINK